MAYLQPTRPSKSRSQKDESPTRRRGCGCLSGLFLGALLLLALIIFAGAGAIGALIYSDLSADIEEGIEALDGARTRTGFESTRIYDRHGQLLWEIFGEGKRTRIPLDQIPADLIEATIATEDDTFYENIGLDAPSLLAALVANLRNSDARPQGASTITQQLVRHIVFDYQERTSVSYDRKTKEIVLAWIMNRRFEKDEILELYLNEIYYGNLAYGVEAAAQTYFGVPARELSLAQASLLAALPQSPIELDPLTNLEGAKERQWLVLNLMVEEGAISRSEAEAAYVEPLQFAPQEVSLEAPHFSVYVRQQLEAEFGPELVANGGLRVTTSLDLDYQRLAEILARRHVDEVGPEHNLTNAALVALKPGSGEILAMLGSLDYRDSDIDGNVNVALTGQQPGSAIKPLTYAAAFSPQPGGGDPAWTAGDILWDVPVAYPQYDGTVYEPVNYSGRFVGPVRLRDALANSYNVPAVLLLQDIGLDRFLNLASRFGISSLSQRPEQYGLSLTLGGGDVTPLELTAAYAVFANGGYRVPSAAVLRVEKSDGQLLYEYQAPQPEPVLDPRVAFLISDILDDDPARRPAMGRDNPLELPFPAAAKTGTSNDFRDNWTVGYTPGLVVGVWAGNSDNSEMLAISGLTGAAPLWSAFMQAIYSDYDLLASLGNDQGQPASEFLPPAGLERRPLCNIPSVIVGAAECQMDDSDWFLVKQGESADPAPSEADRVRWTEVDPGVWSLPVVPLPPVPEELIQISTSFDEEPVTPPQPFCRIEEGLALQLLPPEAVPALFLAPPRNEESLIPAHEWASEHGLAILPAVVCDEALLAAARDPDRPAVYRISNPVNEQVLSGIVPVQGTVDFDPARVQFYKLELGLGDLEQPQWVTLGQTRDQPVINGTLETLYAEGLPPGRYLLRLVVVGWDGNYVGEPYTVQVILE